MVKMNEFEAITFVESISYNFIMGYLEHDAKSDYTDPIIKNYITSLLTHVEKCYNRNMERIEIID